MKTRMLLLAALLSAPVSKLEACEISENCPHHGFAAAKNFTVTVHHAGKPLPGVLVTVIPEDDVDIAGTTEAAGSVLFENLRPGNYHLSVSMLGITSVYQCFHVPKRSTPLAAKRTMTVNWGDHAPETRQLSGKLTSRRFIFDGNGLHFDPPYISGIRLTLTNALTGVQTETTTTPEGLIAFSDIAEGLYVLHSDGDKERRYEPGDLLIRLNRAAARTDLVVELTGPGSCSGPLVLLN